MSHGKVSWQARGHDPTDSRRKHGRTHRQARVGDDNDRAEPCLTGGLDASQARDYTGARVEGTGWLHDRRLLFGTESASMRDEINTVAGGEYGESY